MGNEERLKILKQGTKVWNEWRVESKATNGNLSSVDLSGTELAGANFKGISLNGVDLSGAILDGVDFTVAKLYLTTFQQFNRRNANLHDADLAGTIFADVNLTDAIG